MDKNKVNVPKIRFPGFTDPWEQRKLGEVFEQTSTLVNPKEENLELWSLTVENGLTPKTERYNREFLVKKNDQFKAVHNNEFIYNPMNMTLGAVDLNLTGKTVAVSGYYITMITGPKYDSKYFGIWLKTPLAIKNYKLFATGSLIERQRVQFPTLTQIKAYIPSLDEQQKIGTFFNQLDDTITLHQRKLNHLQDKKKSLLQKMFPKKGENFPELRFPGFTDPWEQRKFSELSEIRRGLTYKPSDVQDKGIRVLRSSNINEDTFVLKADDVFVKPEAANIDFVQNEDILITSANGSSRLVGKHALINNVNENTVHGGFMLLARANKPHFLNALMSSNWYNRFINVFVSGGNGAIGNLSKLDLESQKVFVPNEDEQEKIGSFFKQLDNLITLHQCKLNHLQKQKKALLQQMFI
ncbi:restriction endonuclease subunit S [Clostridium tyrobutyricum]|uniref:restriction endonuclease subunit S n=1 Tax=Clostridium tyrobutyricum TaxID=1519 RepID=UPI00057E6D12|nr:restriction endonuclease subunit S [Clostridium tyrobutyricum]